MKILKLFSLRANKQTDAPGADLNSCRAGVGWDSQTRRNAHPCGVRREVPQKQGGSLSEMGLRGSQREGPLRRLRVKTGGGISLPFACGRGNRELGFWARRSSNSARLGSSKEFRIQRTLRNLTRQPVGAVHSCAVDPFPLRRRFDESASPSCELGASAQEQSQARGCCLGSTFDTVSAAAKQRELGAGRLCGVPARPEY